MKVQYVMKKNGISGIFEGEKMTEIQQQGRDLCKETGQGWPGAFVVWEEVQDTQKQPKTGAKETVKSSSKPAKK